MKEFLSKIWLRYCSPVTIGVLQLHVESNGDVKYVWIIAKHLNGEIKVIESGEGKTELENYLKDKLHPTVFSLIITGKDVLIKQGKSNLNMGCCYC